MLDPLLPHGSLVRRLAGLLALCLCSALLPAMTTRIPEELEQATPAEQQAWLDQHYAEAEKEQKLVGQQRHDARQQEKEKLIHDMSLTALARIRLIQRQRLGPEPPAPSPSVNLVNLTLMLSLLILCITLLVRLYQHARKAQRQAESSKAIRKAMATHEGEYAQMVAPAKPRRQRVSYAARFNYNHSKSSQ